MPKVVQLSSVHPTRDTRIFYKICKGLIDYGYDLDLIIQHPEDEILEGVPIKALPIAKSKLDRPLKVIPALLKKCRTYPRGTIMHFHDPELIPIGLLLKFFRYKVVYDVHEDVPKDLLTKEWIPTKLRGILAWLVKKVEAFSSNFFDGIVTVTNPIADRFKNSTENVIQVRNYPIIDESVNVVRRKTERYVTYIGGLTTRRGIPKIVDALSLVNDSDLKLYLGGEFIENGLEEFVRNKEGWKKTEFLGWVNHDKMLDVLQNALCGLLTLEVIPSHNESLNVKLFEYMLAEIPVISSNLKFPRQIIEEHKCGIIIQENTPEQIANAIDYISANPKEAQLMGERGREAVLNHYNWDSELKKLTSFYSSLNNE